MDGVSIITCTHVPFFKANIFDNYLRQQFKPKELIIILNSLSLDLDEWQKYAEPYKDVRIFVKPDCITVGACMNFAVSQARYDYIANFDHDDYYGAEYIDDYMRVAPRLSAGLFGKKTHYVYIEDNWTLALMYPGHENMFVDYVDGPTMFMKKEIFNQVSFIDNDISDCRLSWDCREKGIGIYSVNRKHFAYIRRPSTELHTWKIDNRELLNNYCKVVTHIRQYRPYVDYR
jgi:glycosyltransferase involved in cell wall biosynthesis